ncbi:spherulation-specific family 4 protein [Streptomyces mangrovisoli]|uniref:Phage tail protein n=1 Tax=Streptomyces mangrovisoli TaxID=1428628 RepID=A0A1J4NNE5_9ACTN|nr:spherulation-specific family 4 protein [Streptomyces mangrovisoli]OIJ63108.1 phage tail protein [Streptomyces mangrovisoli]
MPHLTGAHVGTAHTDVRTGLGVPGFAHPLLAPAEWAELTRPGPPLHWVVLNVAAGPGCRPDPYCLDAGARLSDAGVRVLGHLDADRAGRGFTELLAEAERYADWYRVDGFLVDHCPTERSALPEIRRVVSTLRTLLGGAHVVLGHGAHPHPGYTEVADQLVTFDGPWSEYRWSQVAEWTAEYPPDRFCHFVHGVPRGHLDEALRIARWQGAATVWFTDRAAHGGYADPWEAMPGYWDDIVSRIGTGVSE